MADNSVPQVKYDALTCLQRLYRINLVYGRVQCTLQLLVCVELFSTQLCFLETHSSYACCHQFKLVQNECYNLTLGVVL